ncbi:MAG: YigZ family protein [Lachnospiraceae bacterium]
MEETAYLFLKHGGSGEIEEKKSRFIATIRPVTTEEEAVSFIEEMKKKYWDARHNCHAYVLGATGQIMRYSDDGEPGGTAGKPMLEVLLGSGVRNIAVVVTRYFGGTLLGTGGLVRAYTQAVQEGLKDCVVARKRPGVRLELTTDYNAVGKILYLLGQRKLEPESSIYEADVRLILVVPQEECEKICKEFTEATAGKIGIREIEKMMYEEEISIPS